MFNARVLRNALFVGLLLIMPLGVRVHRHASTPSHQTVVITVNSQPAHASGVDEGGDDGFVMAAMDCDGGSGGGGGDPGPHK